MDIAKLEEAKCRASEKQLSGLNVGGLPPWTFSYPDLIYSTDSAPLDARSNRDYRPAALIRNSKYSINFTAATRDRGVLDPRTKHSSTHLEYRAFQFFGINTWIRV